MLNRALKANEAIEIPLTRCLEGRFAQRVSLPIRW